MGYNDVMVNSVHNGDKIWRACSFSSDGIDLVWQIWSLGLLIMNATIGEQFTYAHSENILHNANDRGQMKCWYFN